MVQDWFCEHQFLTILNPGSSPFSTINFPYGMKIIMKFCLDSPSTFAYWHFDDLSHLHGAGALQRANFWSHFGSSGHGTIGAPEGSPGWRRVLRTMFWSHVHQRTWKHCAPAHRKCFWSDNLGCGDVVSGPIFMISENHLWSHDLHLGCI